MMDLARGDMANMARYQPGKLAALLGSEYE